MGNLKVALAAVCAVVVGGALAARAATLHVATTGSDTEGDGTQATKHCITFSGGWDKDWVKKYTAAPTIIKPPSTSSDCLHFENVRSNNVCDIVLTGGKYGIYPVGNNSGTFTSTKIFHADREW